MNSKDSKDRSKPPSSNEHLVSIRAGHLTVGPYNSLIAKSTTKRLVDSWDFVLPGEDAKQYVTAPMTSSKAGTLVDTNKLVFTIPSSNLISVFSRRHEGGMDVPLAINLEIDAYGKGNATPTRMRVECKGVVCFAFRQAINDCILVGNTVAEANTGGRNYDLKFVMFGVFNRIGEKDSNMPIYVIKSDGSLVLTEVFRVALTQALEGDTSSKEPYEFLDNNLSH